MNVVSFTFDTPLSKPIHNTEAAPPIPAPSQTTDGDEYICGCPEPMSIYPATGTPSNNPGRDQDRSRQDERQAASPFARYVS